MTRRPQRPLDRGDDQSDSRSIISFESVDSHGGYSASSSQGSIYEQGQVRSALFPSPSSLSPLSSLFRHLTPASCLQHGHGSNGQDWEPQYASTKREEFNESSAASVLSAGFTPSSSQALEAHHHQRVRPLLLGPRLALLCVLEPDLCTSPAAAGAVARVVRPLGPDGLERLVLGAIVARTF